MCFYSFHTVGSGHRSCARRNSSLRPGHARPERWTSTFFARVWLQSFAKSMERESHLLQITVVEPRTFMSTFRKNSAASEPAGPENSHPPTLAEPCVRDRQQRTGKPRSTQHRHKQKAMIARLTWSRSWLAKMLSAPKLTMYQCLVRGHGLRGLAGFRRLRCKVLAARPGTTSPILSPERMPGGCAPNGLAVGPEAELGLNHPSSSSAESRFLCRLEAATCAVSMQIPHMHRGATSAPQVRLWTLFRQLQTIGRAGPH